MHRPLLGSSVMLVALALPFLGCDPGAGAPPSRECRALVWARDPTNVSSSGAVLVTGSWDGWASAAPLTPFGDEGWKVRLLDIPPGEYAYRLIEHGSAHLDPYSPQSTYEDGEEASLLVVPDCSAPEVRVDSVTATASGDAIIDGTFFTAKSHAEIDPASVSARFEIEGMKGEGNAPEVAVARPADGRISIVARALSPGKYTLSLDAKDIEGHAVATVRTSVWVKPPASPAGGSWMESWQDGVLYQIVIDRFRGNGGAPLAPPQTPGARAGGTLDGVRAEIERGTFDALGVTALWLSPVYTNPSEPFPGRDGHSYEAYHGYWPLDSRGVDPHLGDAASLRAVVTAAHRRGIRVLFDFVPNHVYKDNPRYVAHAQQGYFNDGPDHCICGDPGCGWGDHLLTCWFSSYLPDVRFQEPEQMKLGAKDARWWMETYDADGVRVDAVPMMPRPATRRIAEALHTSRSPRGALFSIGEVYTGAGVPGIDMIRYFLGPDGIDGAFDFPLMWAARDVFGTRSQGFSALEGILADTEQKLEGSGAVMGRMLDNHDTSRFISEADGTAYRDPWGDPAPQPSSAVPYRREEMAFAFLFTLPGLPIIYHGDEVGLAGATDPDARRVMPDPSALSADQTRLRGTVARLSALRRCLPALRRGARTALVTSDDAYAYLRDAGDGAPAIALFSRLGASTTIDLPASLMPAGAYRDVISGEAISLSRGGVAMPVTMAPESFRILIPSSSPCNTMP